MKRKLLWVGDAACASGFARCTHAALDVLRETWDVHVLALNYFGDPHSYPYPIYPCHQPLDGGHDGLGVQRLPHLLKRLRPDVVVVLNDPWNLPAYMQAAGNVPVVAWLAVDGKNIDGAALNGLAGAVFWTRFGEAEARKTGYAGTSAVVPLGVDLETYVPQEKMEARRMMGLEQVQDAFIVGNVNRNQVRKRLDLTVSYFAEWVTEYQVHDAQLMLYVAPTGDLGYDVSSLMKYYGLSNRLILVEPPIGTGYSEAALACSYSTFDLQVTTTQGEGWGLTQMEGMACGVTQIVPAWSALGEWTEGAACQVRCADVACTAPMNAQMYTMGGVPDRQEYVEALDRLYRDRQARDDLVAAGHALVGRPEYRWPAVGAGFGQALEQAMGPRHVLVKPAVPQLVAAAKPAPPANERVREGAASG